MAMVVGENSDHCSYIQRTMALH